MKVLFACGGTGGHINPALAVAGALKQRDPSSEILFVGSPSGMEANLVPRAGFDFAPMKVKGFQRKLSFSNIKNNFMALVFLAGASRRAKEILDAFCPDIVLGTGGYASGPMVYTAAKRGVPTLTHEQNAYPGVTTRVLSKSVDKVLLSVDAAREYLKGGADCVLTGNPVRREFFTQDRSKIRREMGIDDKICVLSFGGSLGAQRLNEAIAALIAHNRKNKRIFHIHATGSYGAEIFPKLLQDAGVDPGDTENLDIREYIYDMPRCFAAADLVICRCGASTLSELEASGKASILVPSPNVAANHQFHNAQVLARHNAAVVIEEKDLTPQRLAGEFDRLVQDSGTLAALGRNAAKLAVADADERILKEMYSLYESRRA